MITKHWVTSILLVILLYLFVFGDNSLIKRWSLSREVRLLKAQKEYYINKIEQDSLMLDNLKDDVYLEKFAREKYLMKRENETIYIVK